MRVLSKGSDSPSETAGFVSWSSDVPSECRLRVDRLIGASRIVGHLRDVLEQDWATSRCGAPLGLFPTKLVLADLASPELGIEPTSVFSGCGSTKVIGLHTLSISEDGEELDVPTT